MDSGAPSRPGPAPKLIDGFAKQLIALAPAFWAAWATGRAGLRPGRPPDPEFRLAFRQADTLLPVTDAAGGEALILFELQYAHDEQMPRRLNAYASQAEEKHRLPVFPVLVNFQPPPSGAATPAVYESACFDLRVRREFRTINLWEVPAARAFEPDAAALLALLPFLAGGESVPLMERALAELRRRTHPPDLELFLLYLVQKVGGDAALGRLGARLDMAMLQQTAWCQEIIEQGIEQGRQEGIDEGVRRSIRHILEQRFGPLPPDVAAALDARAGDELEALTTAALTADSLDEFRARLGLVG
jgi:predicted transposase YdaD